MKIKEVIIHNYKSISQDCPLNMDMKITPLVGASETGKTNILKALNKFFSSGAFDESDICTFSEQPIGDDSYMVSVTFVLEDFDKEDIAKIDERFSTVSEFTIRKQKDGQYVLEESGLGEGQSMEPQPPTRLTKLHDIIRSQLENANTQLAEFYQSFPDQTKGHHIARQALDAWTKHMPLSGFSPRLSEAEEQDFLMTAQNSADKFSTQVHQLPNVPTQLIETANSLRDLIREATTLSYEVPSREEIHASQLLELCPHALYIEDADIQPLTDSIPISELEAGDGQASIYQTLLQIAKISVADLRDTNVTRRERKFRNGAANVNRFLELWTQEKLEAKFVVDPDNLLFHITGEEGHYGNLSDRSGGFRWFLSFCLSYGLPMNSIHSRILLLDEPGLHLHASAQKDLLELFESMAGSCQIIYTTHSPFMINKNYPERIRGVFKHERPQGTTIDNKPYRPTKGGYYEPIRSSIGITLGNSLFIGGCNLIVEGIADQIILTVFSRYLGTQDKQSFIDLQQICLTPAGGAGNVPYFAYLCSVEGMQTVVLLDNDKEGDTAFSRIEKDQVFSTQRVVRVRDGVRKNKQTVIELESLIDPEFYHTAFLQAYEELTGVEFLGDLPKTNKEMDEQLAGSRTRETEQETSSESDSVNENKQQTNPEGKSKNTTKKHQEESRGITASYSAVFDKHKDKGWGHFDKVLVARKISQKLDDGESPGATTISNFGTLFKRINDVFKQDNA